MVFKVFITAVFVFASFFTFSQETAVHSGHKHEHDHEHHPTQEVGISVAPVYFLNEKELSPSLHVHYTYYFPDTKFGLGLAYEHVFDEHQHNFLGIEGAFRPAHPLTLNFTPGLTFSGAHPDEKAFAFHFETVYEFEFGRFHLGPVFEFAYHPEDYHLSLGIHLGLGL